MFLSVIIPAYNEEGRIEKTLLDIYDYMKNQPYNWEIIVVDDGSKDKTAEIAEELRLKIPNLKIIANGKNRGKGFSVRRGLIYAAGEYRLFTDADNSTSIREIEKFIPCFGEYDIIIGSRTADGAKIAVSQPLIRIILGKFYGWLSAVVVGRLGIKDTQCGFKTFSAKAVENIVPQCRIDGWSFDIEILALAKKTGLKIKEVPVVWENDRNSKMRLKSAARSIFDLIKIRWILMQKY